MRKELSVHGNKYINLIKLIDNNINVPKIYLLSNVLKQNFNYPLILRSSYLSEDGKKFSYAGLFNSYFPIYKLDDINDLISKDIEKLRNNNIIKKISNEINYNNINGNYFLQDFVVGELSGIAFSEYKKKYIRIEYVPGLNFNLSDGRILNPSIIIYNKNNFYDYNIENIFTDSYFYTIKNNKKVRVKYKNNIDYVFHEISLKLLEYIFKIEKIYGYPQDIEFTVNDGKIYILQTRNITIPI